jgi:hypothetical protein
MRRKNFQMTMRSQLPPKLLSNEPFAACDEMDIEQFEVNLEALP